MTVRQDWDNDGYLIIKGARTIKRFNELRDKSSKVDVKKFRCFFALSDKQFEEGIKEIGLGDDEKVVRGPAGLFGVRDGMDRLFEEWRKIDEEIKRECDPQEIYYYEYNNYECCIDWDGDERALKYIINMWGIETARKIRRLNALHGVDEIAADDRI